MSDDHYYIGGGSDGCLGAIFVLAILPFWIVWHLVRGVAGFIGGFARGWRG